MSSLVSWGIARSLTACLCACLAAACAKKTLDDEADSTDERVNEEPEGTPSSEDAAPPQTPTAPTPRPIIDGGRVTETPDAPTPRPIIDGGRVTETPDARVDASSGPKRNAQGYVLCEDEVALLDSEGNETGLTQCSNGMVRRLEGNICPSQVPERQPGVDGDTEAYSCEVDEECSEAPYGYCEYFGMGESECMYGCVSDEDCESGNVCDCREPVGACVEAHCRSDEDCEDGALCVADWSLWNCGSILSFSCQRPEDECGGPLDCELPPDADDGVDFPFCMGGASGPRTCSTENRRECEEI